MKNFIKDFNQSTSNEIIDIIDRELVLSQSNAMWHGRALSLLIPIVNSLIWMRDHKNKEITPQSLIDAFYLNKVRELYETETLPKDLRENIYKYLISLPCYNINLDIKENQPESAIENHLYIQTSIAYILGNLSGVGNIFYKQILEDTENLLLHSNKDTI